MAAPRTPEQVLDSIYTIWNTVLTGISALLTIIGGKIGRLVREDGTVANIGNGVNDDGSLNTLGLTVPCDSPLLGTAVTSGAHSGASQGGTVTDLRDLYHRVGTDQMLLLLNVTTIGSGNTLSLTVEYYDVDAGSATGNLSTTAAKTVTGQAEATANGITSYSIPVADQFWPGMKVTIARTAGSAAWTAGAKVGYVTVKAVRQ